LELGKIRYEPSFRSVRFVTETHSAWSKHSLGHTVERSYRVGQAFKQTEVDVQQKILESKQQVCAALEEEIISHLKLLLQQGLKVTKTKLKNSVKGKAQTITDTINNLIERNRIKVLPNNSLALGFE
jgi:predicted HTH transcriptional regulator